MRLRTLPSLALLIVCATVLPEARQLRKIGEMELSLVGLSATVDGARPAIPKNVASGVKILISGGGTTLAPGAAARLLGAFEVEGEISGPSFGETVTLRQAVLPSTTASDLILPLPAMAVSGEHTLSNLRIVSGGHPVLDLQPHSVPVDVVEQVLITSVRTRPLTLQEIKDKGIVLDSDDYLGFEFTLGVLLESKPVNIAFPVIFDRQGIAVPVPQSAPSIGVADFNEPMFVPKMIPLMMKIPKLGPGDTIGLDFTEDEIRIPSLLVIPGEVGYLKQFFSAQLFVGNGTPATANLIVRDLTGTLELPNGLDATPNTPDDPLSPAETVNGVQPLMLTIAGVGPDGKAGTADDITSLRPGDQGQAEFLVRGDLEGFHNIAFDIEGVLDGLPTGPITVTGRASGGVLVRNPFFDVSFTLPTVVRANEPFKLYATVTNKGEGLANDVSMTLDSASLSGLSVIGDASKSIDTLMPGEAETLIFDFLPTRTGQAVATYLRFEGPGATGSLKFKVGVGERNVPLSPDTLVLPSPVDELPDTVIATAMRVLGQAWSIANTPPNAMPPGVTRISKPVVTTKALALAEAGLRIRLGQAEADAIRDLLADFYGPAPIDRGFDQLLRMTDAGRNFSRAVGAALAPTAAANASALEAAYAAVAASGGDFVSFSIGDGASNADVDVKLLDAANRQLVYTGGNSDPRPTLTSAAIAPLGPPATSPLFGIIAVPSAMPYTIELSGRGGSPVDLSVTYPRGDGRFTRARVTGVNIAGGAKARVVIDPARASPAIEIDADANGTIDSTVPLQTDVIAAAGPHLISASVVGPETLDSAGPFGFNVALLFDRLVNATAAADRSHYSIPDNRFVSARRQLSGRLVFGALAMPEGPYVPSSVTVSGMTDPRGVAVGSESAPLQSLLEEPGAVISGRVINGDGQLAAGLRVIYSGTDSWKDCQSAELIPLAETVTDASGRYQFHYIYQDRCIGWRMLAVDAINHSDRSVGGRVLSPGQRITADIALLGRGGVTGIVRDLNGTPVPDAQVIAISTIEPTVGGAAKTDGDGRYLINGITVGPISVKSAKGFSVGTAAGLIARAGTIATADVTLNAGTVAVSGVVKTVLNGVATPVAGAIVVFDGPDPLGTGFATAGAATSGVDGKYALSDMPAGPYVIRAKLANGDAATLTGASTAGDVITGRDILIQITRNARVSGVVRYPDGSPVPTPVVTLSGLGTVGEQDGTFVIENALVSPNPQPIVAYSIDGLREGRSQVLINQSGQQLSNVIVTMNGIGALDLIVLDGLGQPVRNQIVQIAKTSHNISPTDCTAFYLAPTDNEGRVQFAGLEVGAVRVVSIRATANGVDIAKLDTTIPYEGATVSGVLRFGGGGVVRGTVRDDLNQPVFGANIEITSKIYNSGMCAMVGGVSHRLRTSLNGEYRVSGVPVGNLGLSASQEFFPTPVGGSGVLARDGDELVIDLKLIHTTAGKMTGKVFLPDGVTRVGAGVSVSAIGALPEVLVYTNADGEFAFPKIFPAGTYTITVRDAITGYVAQERVALTAGTDLQHDFRLKGRGTVRVRVVDGGDVPVSNALVTLKESEYPNETFEAVVEPSNEGVVTFINVHEGDFSVSASDPFARGGRISAELPSNGATVDATVRLTVTGTVTGRFMLPDQTLIPFGVVKLIANNRVIGQSTTESGENSGQFQFSYVPAGTIKIEASDPATGRSGVAIGQLTTEGQVVTLDVHTQGLGIVTGVITSNGVPQDGANVSVSSGSFRATANADGNGVYYIPGVPEGTITVRADIEGALSSTTTGTLLGDGTTLTLDVALQASGAVVGVVTAADGVTPAPPSIVTMPIGAGRFTTTTNDLGEYRFDLVPAGTRSVSVDVIGSIDTAVGAVVVSGGQTATLPLHLVGVGTIAGTAQTAGGLPIGGTVTLTGAGVVPWSTTLTVNPDGSFIAAQVLAGPFTAQVRNTVGSITLYGTTTDVVSPGAMTNIIITLQSTGDVRGTVMRADGTTPATGAVVTLLLGSSTKGTAQVFSTGEFSFTGLPLGVYSVSVYDTITNGYARALNLNLAANGDVAEAGVLTLDNTSPAVVSVDPADGAIGVSRTKPIVITFTDPIAGTSGVNLRKDSTIQGSTKSLSTDGRVLTMTGTWVDSAELTVEVTTSVADVFGRHPAAQFTSHFTTVDTTAPTVTTVSPVDDAIQIGSATTIVATFSEPIANASLDGLIVVKRSGIVVPGTTMQGPANVLTFTAEPPLSDNSLYTVAIDGAVDASGNEQGAAKNTNFATTDTVDPVLTITSPSLTAWITDSTPSIVVTRSDATSGLNIGSGTVKLDGNTAVVNPSASTMSYAVPAASPLADGTHVIDATSADQAGNTGGSVSGTFKIDATDPSAPVITNISDGNTIAGTTSITATATDAMSGVELIKVYRNGTFILDLPSPSFTATWNAAFTAEGQYVLTARATDEAGNVGPDSAPIAIVVDNDPLVLTITAPLANLTTRRPFTAVADASEAVDHVEFSIGGVTVNGTFAAGDIFSALVPVNTLPEGNNVLTVTAYGLLGEVVTQTRTIVIDRSTPVARWPFDEGTGTATADVTGNGHAGTLVNGAAWSAIGQFAKAITFDGLDDGVSVADSDDFDASAGVSMAAWVAPVTFGAPQSVIYRGGSYTLSLENDGRVTAVVYPNGVAAVVQTLAPISLNQWTHLAATYDQSAFRLYVDGVEAAVTAVSGLLATTDGDVWVGRAEVTDSFNGKLDEVRIYDRALSATEVLVLGTPPATVYRIGGANESTFVATPGGPVWSWGRSTSGDLGQGGSTTTADKPTPAAVAGVTDVIDIGAGDSHGVLLTSAGTVYTFGSNVSGQLGDGQATRSTPVALSLDSIVAVASGRNHVVALRSNGDVYTWGSNSNGQQGNTSTTVNSLTPHVIMNGVKAIAAGSAFSLFVKTDGTVWGIGQDSSGQLGANGTAAVRATPVQMIGVTGAVEVTGGNSFSTVRLANGTLKSAGEAGKLGVGDGSARLIAAPVVNLVDIVRVSAGVNHTLALKADGTVWAWGVNSNGGLGNGSSSGSAQNTPSQVIGLPAVADIGAHWDGSHAVTEAGVIYGWGENGHYEVGDGANRNRLTPVAVTLDNYVFKLATPMLSGTGGTFAANQSTVVSINSQVTGAKFYSTRNGVEATENDTEVFASQSLTIDSTQTLSVKAFKAGMPPSNAEVQNYILRPLTPSITPNGGSNYTGNITMSTTTAGAVVRYTTGTTTNPPPEPTETSTLYTTAIQVTTPTIFKAAAFKAGWTQSASTAPSFTFKIGVPTMSPAGGTFVGSVNVTLAHSVPGTIIRWLIGTTAPSCTTPTGTVYTAPIPVVASGTLRIRACHPDYLSAGSDEVANAFTIQAGAPVFSLAAGAYDPGTQVTVTGEPGSTIRYTLSGVDPTDLDAIVANGGTLVVGNFTLKARATAAGKTASAITSADYTLTGELSPPAIALGFEHALASMPDGRLFGWGSNFRGQLGNGESGASTPEPVPSIVSDLTGVVSLAAGDQHSLAITTDRRLWSFGYNNFGQLGDGSTTLRPRPVPVSSWTNVAAVAAGPQHSLALLDNGDVYGWGSNSSVALCDANSSATFSSPRLLMSDVVAISGGTGTTHMVKSDGTVWSCGLNTSGQLGDNSLTSRSVPTQMSGISSAVAVSGGGTFSVVLLADGTLRAAGAAGRLGDGNNTLSKIPVTVVGLSDVVAVDAGTFHTLAVKSDGTVWAWGSNSNGQLGNPAAAGNQLVPIQVSGLAGVAVIHATSTHSMALTADRVLYGWGGNAKSEIGDGTARDRVVPTPISEPNHTWKTATPTLSVNSGTFNLNVNVVVNTATAGATIHYTRNGVEPAEVDPVVAAGASLLIDATQTLSVKAFTPGMPPSNVGSETYTLKPVTPTFSPNGGTNYTGDISMSTTTAAAVVRYTTGTASNPPPDPTESSTPYTAPIQVTTPTVFKAAAFKTGWTPAVSAPVSFTFTVPAPVMSPAGGTFVNSTTVSLSPSVPGTTIRWLIGSTAPSCTTPTGSVYTGPITVTTSGTLRARACHPDYLAAGSTDISASFTIQAPPPTFSLDSGTYAPGTQVVIDSDPSTTIRISLDGVDPTSSSPSIAPGTALLIGEFTLKARAFRAGAVDSAVVSAVFALTQPVGPGAIAGGRDHGALLTPDGRVFTWGDGGNGQLGAGNLTRRSVPGVISEISGISSIAAGYWHMLALTIEGRVIAWGYNPSGQLGIGNTSTQYRPVPVTSLTNVIAVAAGVEHSIALTAAGEVFAFGDNNYGQLGVGGSINNSSLPILVPDLPAITAVAAGNYHGVALAADGRVFAWGYNEFGQVGDGTTDWQRPTPVEVPGLTDIVAVDAGNYDTVATRRDGRVFVWGYNTHGELGLGSIAEERLPVWNPALDDTAVAAGWYGGMARRWDGSILVWGDNRYGQIGDGTLADQLSPVPAAVPNNPLSFFYEDHPTVLTPTGEVWSWGRGLWGRLGNGSEADQVSPQQAFTMSGPWAPAPPLFSVAPGTYATDVTLVISSSMAGATMRYTLDGSTPDESSLELPANGELLINSTTTVRARVFAPGRKPSVITAGTYVIQP